MMLTAPSGPITAISAAGYDTLKSARMCLLPMTSYAPPYDLRVITVILRHVVVHAAVLLSRDHRDLRHRRLGERVEQLRAVLDDAAVLLVRAREKARH